MDMSNGIAGLIPNIEMTQVLNFFLIGSITILVLGLIAWFFWKRWNDKRYTYEVRIIEEDSYGKIHETKDRGGIFLDKKTGFTLFFLKKHKKGLNPNKVPYIDSYDKKGRLIKIVKVRRIGISNFVFIEETLENGKMKFTIGEEDINWASVEMEKVRRTFGKEPLWAKLAPYIMFIITILIVMIILISLFNKFEVIKEASANMEKVSEKQLEITQLMFNMSQAPQFNKGPIIVAGVK